MTTIISKSGTGVPAPDKLETAELAVDVSSGDLYTKLSDNSVVQINGGSASGGTGSSVHIGENPPADPQEGQQWMEVPTDGDATMWIYDGGKWLQQPGGKDGAPGADGNIADGTQDGIVATWDDTAKQWTPDSSMVIDSSGNVGIGGITTGSTEGLNLKNNKNIAFKDGTGSICNMFRQTTSGALVLAQGYKQSGTPNGFASSLGGEFTRSAISVVNEIAFYVDAAVNVPEGTDFTPTKRMSIDSNGRVDITGSLYVNGTPKIGADDLIRTLETLRNATKDETTLEGLRDSIGNAIGGLIEEFENQISTMPAGEES